MNRFLFCVPALLLTCSQPALTAQTAAPSAAASSSPVATATSASSPELREFQKVEDNWSESVNTRDQYGLELVLSPLFVDVSAGGDITTRNQQVASTIGGEDKTLHLDQRVVTVRMLGDVAVASGTYALRHKVGSSEANEKGVFTHVFQRSHGSWLCVNSQRTLLREDPTAKQQKKASNAEMPFHIPLFSKGDKTNGPTQ